MHWAPARVVRGAFVEPRPSVYTPSLSCLPHPRAQPLMKFLSYAQNHEDVMLRRAFAGVSRGFYVDVGAHDPVVDSVTKAFYEMGWRGINVDPVPSCMERLRRDRPEDVNLRVAASDANGETRFFEIVGTGLSTAVEDIARLHSRDDASIEVREYAVETRTLTSICADHAAGEIHFLKIDVEGWERRVLEGMDLSRIRPWIVLVEATHPNTRVECAADWEPLLTDRGYHHVWFDGLNRFYVADERSSLDDAFQTPPNVWDGFETLALRLARVEASASGDRIAELHQEQAALQSRLAVAKTRAEARERELVASVRLAKGELQGLYESASWRVTAPGRLMGRALRAATLSPSGERLGPRGVAAATVDLVRRAARKLLRRLVRGVDENPRAKASLVRVSRALPFVDAWLSRYRDETLRHLRGSESPGDDLPRRARRILAELREVRARSGR